MTVATLIISFIMCVGLGYGLVMLNSKMNDIRDVLEERVNSVKHDTEQLEKDVDIMIISYDNLAEQQELIHADFNDIAQEFITFKRKVIGTADIDEFARLKTIVYGEVQNDKSGNE